MVKRNFSVQGLMNIVAVHTDDTFASAESHQPVISKATVANEQATRPSSFLLDLAMKGMQFSHTYRLILPFSLNEIDFIGELETTINLFTTKPERILRHQPIDIKELFQKFFEGITP